MDKFVLLLADLGALINIPLRPDASGGCSLKINNTLDINLKEDENNERLLIATFLSELFPGKFREHVLKELLKENGLPQRIGTFGYSGRNHQLAFFSYLHFSGLRGDALADFLEQFIEKSLSWKRALETGELPHRYVQKKNTSIFDIHKS